MLNFFFSNKKLSNFLEKKKNVFFLKKEFFKNKLVFSNIFLSKRNFFRFKKYGFFYNNIQTCLHLGILEETLFVFKKRTVIKKKTNLCPINFDSITAGHKRGSLDVYSEENITYVNGKKKKTKSIVFYNNKKNTPKGIYFLKFFLSKFKKMSMIKKVECFYILKKKEFFFDKKIEIMYNSFFKVK